MVLSEHESVSSIRKKIQKPTMDKHCTLLTEQKGFLQGRYFTSAKARMIFQSSLAIPGAEIACRVDWARPSVLTYVPSFSVKAQPGNTTSARQAPWSPWEPA